MSEIKSSNDGPYSLFSTYVRLRSDVSMEPLPVDDTFWQRISKGELGSFHKEYLVSSYVFDADWPTWEMHPNGDEIVCLLSGAATFVLEQDGERRDIELEEAGTFIIVPRGTWHTARVGQAARMLFVTAGEGTRHREAG